MKRACVFAHFDLHDEVDDHVIYYLKCLRATVDDLLFVTVSQLGGGTVDQISALGIRVIQRDNEGYDFCSYKTGIDQLNLDDYDELLLCNDSVYGPFVDLGELTERMRTGGADFWGITENFEYARHLQSYYLCFTKKVLQSAEFCNFWSELEALENKREIIRRYEVGLSQRLLKQGFRAAALVSFEQESKLRRVRSSWRQYLCTVRRRWLDREFYLDVFHILFSGRQIAVNPTHMEWKSLLIDHHSPFVKIELLRDNPKGMDDLDSISSVISGFSDYPSALISAHLARVGRAPE